MIKPSYIRSDTALVCVNANIFACAPSRAVLRWVSVLCESRLLLLSCVHSTRVHASAESQYAELHCAGLPESMSLPKCVTLLILRKRKYHFWCDILSRVWVLEIPGSEPAIVRQFVVGFHAALSPV